MTKRCVWCNVSLREKPEFSVARLVPRLQPSVSVISSYEEYIGVEVTPARKLGKGSVVTETDKCVCGDCFYAIGRVARLKQQLKTEEARLEKRGECSSYLGRKRSQREAVPANPSKRTLTPRKTPVKAKMQRLSSPFQGSHASVGPHRSSQVHRRTFKVDVLDKVDQGNYGTAVDILMHKSKQAKEQILRVLMRIVRKEVAVARREAIYCKEAVTADNVLDFKWHQVLSELETAMPTLMTILTAALTARHGKKAQEMVAHTQDDHYGPLVPGLGCVALTLLHLRHPFMFRRFQGMMSAMLYRCGNSHKLEKCLNHLGLCLGVHGTKGTVDRVRKAYDREVMQWKLELEGIYAKKRSAAAAAQGKGKEKESEEKELDDDWVAEQWAQREDESPGEARDEGDTSTDSWTCSSDDDDDDDDGADTEGFEELATPLPPDSPETVQPQTAAEYSLVWDNVGKLRRAKLQSLEHQNKMMLWAMVMAVKHRVPYDGPQEAKTVPASSIPMDKYFLGPEDWESIYKYTQVLVQRILIEHMPYFQEQFGNAPTTLKHDHTRQMNEKSDIINLGVIDADPTSTKGVVHILKALNEYVPYPDGTEGEPFPILCEGDQSSVERMVSARQAMVDQKLPRTTLKGLEPSPQEFHHRMICMQNTYNDLFKASSAREAGTLFNIKCRFQHRSVKAKVSENIQNCYQLLNFCTEGMVCLLAMQLLEMENQSDIPQTPTDLNKISEEIVQFLKPFQVIQQVKPNWEAKPTFCICQASSESLDVTDADISECSSKENCQSERYFHTICLTRNGQTPQGHIWHCSKKCREYTPYCCNAEKPDLPEHQWLGCDNEGACVAGEWFHLSCVNLHTIPDDEWICPACVVTSSTRPKKKTQRTSSQRRKKAKKQSSSYDSMCEYSRALAWEGLMHQVRVDAEREGNGPMLMLLWRYDMPGFLLHNNNKYLILAHRVTSAINGYLEPRLAHHIMHNRVANTWGLPGRNIALDLLVEHSNNEFKDHLRHTHGLYGEDQVQRASHMAGSFGKALEDVFIKEMGDTYMSRRHKKRTKTYTADVAKFVKEYQEAQLFQNMPGRAHESFPDFIHTYGACDQDLLRKRMKKYAKNLDAEMYNITLPQTQVKTSP